MTNKPPRRHHYTPVFYLKRFADADGRLHIVSRDTGKRWTSNPENTGLEKDFYTLEDMPEGEDQYFIEKSFAEFEGKAASVLDEIIDSRAIPKDKDRFDILRPPGFFGPAFRLLNTDATIPLSSRVALVGRFEDTPERLELNAQSVGSVNAKTIGYSQRFIAACADEFLFHNMELGTITDKEVIA